MRITDDRYSRDRLRLDLALRFILHEARTKTIRLWTGLTDDRVRRLYRSYMLGGMGPPVRRRRGKSPKRAHYFMRTPRLQQEAAFLASLCSLLGVLPARVAPEVGHALPSVMRGELLCQAFEAYRALLPSAQISFEHAVFLVVAIARGDELRLSRCPGCDVLLVGDRLSLRQPRCSQCTQPAPRQLSLLGESPNEAAKPRGRARRR